MDMNTIAVISYMLFTILLLVYMWRTCGVENRVSDIEALIKIREEDLKAIHNAIKQLNENIRSTNKAIKQLKENQKLFLKPGEPVIFWRQEEEFHK